MIEFLLSLTTWAGCLVAMTVSTVLGLAEPPVYIYVVFFGFLLAVACFGIYRPQLRLVVLVSLCTLFIGLVLYLILALSDPFQGGTGVEPTTFERLVTKMRTEQGPF